MSIRWIFLLTKKRSKSLQSSFFQKRWTILKHISILSIDFAIILKITSKHSKFFKTKRFIYWKIIKIKQCKRNLYIENTIYEFYRKKIKCFSRITKTFFQNRIFNSLRFEKTIVREFEYKRKKYRSNYLSC